MSPTRIAGPTGSLAVAEEPGRTDQEDEQHEQERHAGRDGRELEGQDAAHRAGPVPEADQGRLQYRLGKAGFYSEADPAGVAERLAAAVKSADTPAEEVSVTAPRVSPPCKAVTWVAGCTAIEGFFVDPPCGATASYVKCKNAGSLSPCQQGEIVDKQQRCK